MPYRIISIILFASWSLVACGGSNTNPTTTAAAQPTVRPASTTTPRPSEPPQSTQPPTVIEALPATATSQPTRATPTPAPSATPAPRASATPAPPTIPEPSATPEPKTTPEPSATPEPTEAAAIKLEVVAEGFRKPLYLVSARDDSGRLFVVEQAGVVKILRNGRVVETPFLDIAARVESQDNERGLLSIAFHPQFRSNGFVYADYTDLQGNTVVSRFTAAGDQADPTSEQIILTIEQPYANHNGGQLQLGPDGYLYISLGDGGSAGDPENRAQNLDNPLGKLLRIDVNQGDAYGIPGSNPFANGGGKPEIWAYGLRNPWRFSFDRATGDLWIGDVGQGKWEEIDVQPAGQAGLNYGWKQVEGPACYVDGCDVTAYTAPVASYDHGQGCSVTGGYVYRGSALPQLRGWYFYGDFCSGTIWMLRNNGNEWQNRIVLKDSGAKITSFGEDQQGELYVIDREGRVLRVRQ